ncbi:MAG: nucleotide pyrophosphatase [Leptolyngbya sp. SIO1D8]|nr:nucleotide pyrophosphatase [Leptolyngbya sp. SIO1D8]
MKSNVIAIGLDAADPNLIEPWLAEGHLPTLQKLREQGAFGRLSNIDHFRAETPWTTFLSGCSPKKTGYWGPVEFDPKTYLAQETGAHDFKEFPPFYALGSDFEVAAFDIPQSSLSERVNGLHVLGWGAHSPMTPSHSTPTDALTEIIQKHGEHPAFLKDFADCRDVGALKRLQKVLEVGIQRRAEVCRDLLQQKNWNLLLTIFGETHTAGHYMWHLSQADHPLHALADGCPDLMLKTFKAVDRAIAHILEEAPADANVVVFAAHGMGSNVMDVPSMLLLPELMYRYSFPGKVAIAPGKVGAPLPPPSMEPDRKRGWVGEVWNLRHEPNPLMRWLRTQAPVTLYKPLDKFLNRLQQPYLISSENLMEAGDPLFWQPAQWYMPMWPRMKAFALPSYSEGYIRINLQGREAKGSVAPADYEATCQEVEALLYDLKDARSGQPLVEKVIRTRSQPFEDDSKLPDADLVAIWQDDLPSDVVDSSQCGRIGPVPHHRSGSHRSRGFIVAKGPDIEAGMTLATGHALDLAPTLLQLMGAPIPEHFEGRALFSGESAVMAV